MKFTEKHIQETCSDWLSLDNWRLFRTDLPHLRGLGVQEPGMADSLYIRYPYNAFPQHPNTDPLCEVMHIEWKKKGVKAAQHQQDWHARERARGALTLIAGEDFPASIEGFAEWYAKSGLQRKKMSLPR